MPTTSVIILNHEKARYTEACLNSLLATGGSSFEVLAVDNGSHDDTPAVLARAAKAFEEKGLPFRVMRYEENIGAVMGRNRAMEQARGDYFAFVDNDVMVRDRRWLSKLCAVLEEEPRAAIVGPKLVFPWEPFDIECAGCAVSPGGRVQYVGRGAPIGDERFSQRREVQCLISACIVLPRKLIDEVGPLDEAFSPVQYEDIDLCYRVRERGYRVLYVPEVETYHWENVTTEGSVDLNFKYLTIRNGMRFKQRWRHKFETEGGPPDNETAWAPLSKKRIEEAAPAPLL